MALQLILGGSGSGKTTALYEMVIQESIQNSNESYFVIVPEQFTSSTEGALYHALGDELSAYVESYSFTSLAETLLRRYGGAAVPTLSEAGRAVLVRRALEELQDTVQYYYRHRRSAAFCQMAAETIDELKSAGLSGQQLYRLAQGCGSGSGKLTELALILQGYETLLAGTGMDPSDRLELAADRLEAALARGSLPEFLQDRAVFIDEFDTFNAPKKRLLAALLTALPQVTVALCDDGAPLVPGDTGLFAGAKQMAAQLRQLARKSGTEVHAPELLRRDLPESQLGAERRITRNLGRMLYAIRARRISTGSLTYTAFFFDARKTPLSPNQVGIRFSTRPEAENAFYSSIFSFAGSISDYQQDIEHISQSTAPVMVTGEDGTGKESIVSVLYMRSPLRNAPLVSINCSLLNDKSWAFLLEHHNSPLADQGNTLYFASIDALSEERRQQLLAVLSEMDVCRRNRVIFSCVCQPGEYTSAVGSLFMDKLCCLSLYLPPLRQMAERIPALVNLSLSHLNVDLPRQIVGADPEAITLLQNFQWPHNYTQFRRVIGELAVTATGSLITAENVRQALRKERHVGAFSPCAENAAAPLNLNQFQSIHLGIHNHQSLLLLT